MGTNYLNGTKIKRIRIVVARSPAAEWSQETPRQQVMTGIRTWGALLCGYIAVPLPVSGNLP